MRGHSYSAVLRSASGDGGDDRQVRVPAAAAASQRQLPAARAPYAHVASWYSCTLQCMTRPKLLFMQSPHWSLAPFGFQRQRTSPRQRASPPAADAHTPQQQAAAKAAARVELGKYVEEIQPAGSPSPRVTPRYRSPRTSPRRGLCSSLCSGAARWVAARRNGSLTAALLAALVLAVLLWGGRQLAAQRRDELQQWMSYVPAVHPSVAFGAARQAAPTPAEQHPPQRCQLQLDGSPWERHCQRLRRVCVDQGSLILYEDRYQQMDGRRAGALPELLVDTSKVRRGRV